MENKEPRNVNVLDRGIGEIENVKRLKMLLSYEYFRHIYSDFARIKNGEYEGIDINIVIEDVNKIIPIIESNFDVFKKRAGIEGTKEEFQPRMSGIIKILEDIRDSKIQSHLNKDSKRLEEPYLTELNHFKGEIQAIGGYLY